MDAVIVEDPERKCKAGRVVKISPDGGYCLQVHRDLGESGYRFDYYSLSDVFEAAASGKVEKEFPDLNAKDIRLCQAFLATNVKDHPAFKSNFRKDRVSILIDENLPYGLVAELTKVLPNLSHVYLEGMEGSMDEYIFNRPKYRIDHDSAEDMLRKKKTKYIIISRDDDLTEIVRQQWMRRIGAVTSPDLIDFKDVTVVFRVSGSTMIHVDNAEYYRNSAAEIMKAAYSGEAASYVISRDGVRVENGSRFHELLKQVEAFYGLDSSEQERLTPVSDDVGPVQIQKRSVSVGRVREVERALAASCVFSPAPVYCAA
ncbi:MAG: hypothetical protein PHX61_05880 [Alphaproteobacteria bacterium]|nr:hypothetical protein [Alphaproteobacteria bacterium]